MSNIDSQNLQLALVAAVAVALVVQTIGLLVMLSIARKSAHSLKEEIEDLRSRIVPVVDNTRDLLERLSPKIESTAEDLAQMARGMRKETAELQASAKAVVERVRVQMGRVDSMVSSVLDAVDRASNYVTEAVSKPVRQISGLLASVKAVVESLRTADTARRVHTPSDDSFI